MIKPKILYLAFMVLVVASCKTKQSDSRSLGITFEDPNQYKEASFSPDSIVPGAVVICNLWPGKVFVDCGGSGFLFTNEGHIFSSAHVTHNGESINPSDFDLSTVNNGSITDALVVYPAAFMKDGNKVITGPGFLADQIARPSTEDRFPAGLSSTERTREQNSKFPRNWDFSVIKIRKEFLTEFLKWTHPLPVTKAIPPAQTVAYLAGTEKQIWKNPNAAEKRHQSLFEKYKDQGPYPENLDFRYGSVSFISGTILPGSGKDAIAMSQETDDRNAGFHGRDGQSGSPLLNADGEAFAIIHAPQDLVSLAKVFELVDFSSVSFVANTPQRSQEAKSKFDSWKSMLEIQEDKYLELEKATKASFKAKHGSNHVKLKLTGDKEHCYKVGGGVIKPNNIRVRLTTGNRFEFSFGFSWKIGWSPWVKVPNDTDLFKHYYFVNPKTGRGGLSEELLSDKFMPRSASMGILNLAMEFGVSQYNKPIFTGTSFAIDSCQN